MTLFQNKIKNFINMHSNVIMLCILVIFVLSRLLFLDKRPCGVNVDEVAGALDAKYISTYGMDRHADHMPPYFKNYGGGMSALYVYFLAFLLKILPFTVRTIRLPAAICGLLCCIYSYRLAKLIFNDKIIALLAPILVTITPFYMASERFGLDCNLFLSIMTIAMYYFIRAVMSKGVKDYIFAGVWLGITLYTYAVSYIIIILFLLVSFIFLLLKKHICIRKWVLMAIPLFVLAFPLILFQLVNLGILPEFTLLGSDYHRLSFYRAAELSFSNIPNNFPFLAVLLLGGDGLKYNAFDKIEFGTVYVFMVPVIIAGIVLFVVDSIKKPRDKNDNTDKNMMGLTIMFFFLAVSIFMILLMSAPSINKANQIYMPFMIFAVYGVKRLSEIWNCASILFLTLCIVFFVLYSKFYFLEQKREYGYLELFYPTISMDIIKYAEENYDLDNNKRIYFEPQYEDLGAEEILLHAISNTNPNEFNSENTDFGKYQLHFPGNFDENENAIYILGINWNHITSYLQSIGFNTDDSFENYFIVYR